MARDFRRGKFSKRFVKLSFVLCSFILFVGGGYARSASANRANLPPVPALRDTPLKVEAATRAHYELAGQDQNWQLAQLPIRFRDATPGVKKNIIQFVGHLDNGDAVHGNVSLDRSSLRVDAPPAGGWVTGELEAWILGEEGLNDGTKTLKFDWQNVPFPYSKSEEHKFVFTDPQTGIEYELENVGESEKDIVVNLRAKFDDLTKLPRDVTLFWELSAHDVNSYSLHLHGDTATDQPEREWREISFFFDKATVHGPLQLHGEIGLRSLSWQTRVHYQYLPLRFWLPPVPTDNLTHPSDLPLQSYAQLHDAQGALVQIKAGQLDDLRANYGLNTTVVSERISPDWRYELAQIALKSGDEIKLREPWPLFSTPITFSGKRPDAHIQNAFYQVRPRSQLGALDFASFNGLQTSWQQVRSRAVQVRFGPFDTESLAKLSRASRMAATAHGILDLQWLQLPPQGTQKFANNQRAPLALWFDYRGDSGRFHFVPTRVIWQDEQGRRLNSDLSNLESWNLKARRPRAIGDPIPTAWRAQFLAPQSQKLWLSIEGIEKETRGQPLLVNN